MTQQAGSPGGDFRGPRLEDRDFVSFDGARLGMQHWDAPGEPWAVVIGLHGMDDYSNTFHLAAEHWATDGISTYAFDLRGFGRSPQRGVWAAAGLMDDDLRAFAALIRQRFPRAIIAVAGSAWAGRWPSTPSHPTGHPRRIGWCCYHRRSGAGRASL